METKSVNTSKKKMLIATGITVLLISAGVAYYLYSKHKKKKDEISFISSIGSVNSNSTSGASSGRLCKSTSYPLAYGTCMDDVKILQRLLQKKGADLGSPAIDGKFGSKTKAAALKYLQKSSFSESNINDYKQQLKV